MGRRPNWSYLVDGILRLGHSLRIGAKAPRAQKELAEQSSLLRYSGGSAPQNPPAELEIRRLRQESDAVGPSPWLGEAGGLPSALTGGAHLRWAVLLRP